MKQRDTLTPSLFDEPATASVVIDVADDADVDEWVEVPQARFLSWSHAMQLHYCWRRDLDAALHVESRSDAIFFLQRAAAYKADLNRESL